MSRLGDWIEPINLVFVALIFAFLFYALFARYYGWPGWRE